MHNQVLEWKRNEHISRKKKKAFVQKYTVMTLGVIVSKVHFHTFPH